MGAMPLPKPINVYSPMIFDHHAVLFRLVVDKPSFRKEKHVFRS